MQQKITLCDDAHSREEEGCTADYSFSCHGSDGECALRDVYWKIVQNSQKL